MLHTLLLTMRATPYIYNGDEIGMTNIRCTRIEDHQDIETRNRYTRMQAEVARENGRALINNLAGSPVQGGTLVMQLYQAIVLELRKP